MKYFKFARIPGGSETMGLKFKEEMTGGKTDVVMDSRPRFRGKKWTG